MGSNSMVATGDDRSSTIQNTFASRRALRVSNVNVCFSVARPNPERFSNTLPALACNMCTAFAHLVTLRNLLEIPLEHRKAIFSMWGRIQELFCSIMSNLTTSRGEAYPRHNRD